MKRVVLVGSSRFGKFFSVWAEALMRAGKSPFSLPPPHDGFARERDESELVSAAHAHRGTIGAMDAMLVLNPGGYIGDSTRQQIKVAQELELGLFCLERVAAGQEHLFHSSWERSLNIPERYTSPISTMKFQPALALLSKDGVVPVRIHQVLQDFAREFDA